MREEIFREIWGNGFIILDTCTLDFIERCEVGIAKKLMDIFLICREQVYVPSHVRDVEMRNYFDLEKSKKTLREKLRDLECSINEVLESRVVDSRTKRNKIKGKTQKLINQLGKYDFQILSKKIKEVEKSGEGQIIAFLHSQECNDLVSEYDEFLNSNTVRDFYSMIMDNVLKAFTIEEIEQIEIEGMERRINNIPPACGDARKSENSYGDLIIWKEILRSIQKEKYVKYLFITEDKKKGNNWFDESQTNIHPLLRKEVENNFGYDAVSICDLKEFIHHCKDFVSEDIDALIKYVEKNSIKVLEIIEEYINNKGYDFVAEKTWRAITQYCDVDYSLPDPCGDFKIIEFDYTIEDCIEAQIRFGMEFDTDSTVRWGGDDWTDSSSVYAELDTVFHIDIIEGYYLDDLFSLDLKNMSFEVIDIDINASAPFGMDDEDYEDYEPDYEELEQM